MEVKKNCYFSNDYIPIEIFDRILSHMTNKTSDLFFKYVNVLSVTSQWLNAYTADFKKRIAKEPINLNRFNFQQIRFALPEAETQSPKKTKISILKDDYPIDYTPDVVGEKYLGFKNFEREIFAIKKTRHNFFNATREITSSRLSHPHCYILIFEKKIYSHMNNEDYLIQEKIPSKKNLTYTDGNLTKINLPVHLGLTGKALAFFPDYHYFISQTLDKKTINIYDLKSNKHFPIHSKHEQNNVVVSKDALAFNLDQKNVFYIYRYNKLPEHFQMTLSSPARLVNVVDDAVYVFTPASKSTDAAANNNLTVSATPSLPGDNSSLHYLTRYSLTDNVVDKISWSTDKAIDQISIHPYKNTIILSELTFNERKLKLTQMTPYLDFIQESNVDLLIQEGEPTIPPESVDLNKQFLLSFGKKEISVMRRIREQMPDRPFRVSNIEFFYKPSKANTL